MNRNDSPHWVDSLADDEVKIYHRVICEEMIESLGDKAVLGRKMLELLDKSESPRQIGLLRELLKIAFRGLDAWRGDKRIQ